MIHREFQTILRLPDSMTKFLHLSRLSKDFLHASKLYAKIIGAPLLLVERENVLCLGSFAVSELYLPRAKKTVQAVELGGVAGGDKYICQGILFKVALDSRGIYGGDHNAMKAAGHELKGLMSYFNCQVEGLNVPLMAIIEYKGFSVTAMSLLPIEKTTIVYGSSNSGRTVANSSPAFARLMRQAATLLNLSEHVAGENRTTIHSPADIEGHLSKVDGRFYLIDFARTMPPQIRLRPKAKQHLYELLRPELVKSNPVPLSSDALTRMGRWDEKQPQHNKAVLDACERLLQQVIPSFCLQMEADIRPQKIAQACFLPPASLSPSTVQPESTSDRFNQFIQKLHQRGINIRLIGFVYQLLKSPSLRKTVLVEMVARILKDGIRARLRTTTRKLKVPASEPYRQIVINFLNEIFVRDKVSFWTQHIKLLIKEKFHHEFPAPLSSPQHSLLQEFDVADLVNRFQYLANIKLKANAVALLQYGTTFLVDNDLIKLGTRVRSMNIIPETEAMVLSMTAHKRVGTERARLYHLALQQFQHAMLLSPNSRFAFFECGKMLHQMAASSPSPTAQIYLLAGSIQKLQQAVMIDDLFLEAHLALGNVTLDFVIHEHRMNIAIQNNDPGLIYQMGDMIKDAALHFSKALASTHIDDSSPKSESSEKKAKEGDSSVDTSDLDSSLHLPSHDPSLGPPLSSPSLSPPPSTRASSDSPTLPPRLAPPTPPMSGTCRRSLPDSPHPQLSSAFVAPTWSPKRKTSNCLRFSKQPCSSLSCNK